MISAELLVSARGNDLRSTFEAVLEILPSICLAEQLARCSKDLTTHTQCFFYATYWFWSLLSECLGSFECQPRSCPEWSSEGCSAVCNHMQALSLTLRWLVRLNHPLLGSLLSGPAKLRRSCLPQRVGMFHTASKGLDP